MKLGDIVNKLLNRGALDNDKSIIEHLLNEAQNWKPGGYDADQARRRNYYEGKQNPYLRAALTRRYPGTVQDMSLIGLNYARLIADTDASTYDETPSRTLTIDGAPLEDTDPRQAEYARIVENAALNVTLAEGERRLMLCNTMFLRVGYDTRKAAPCIDLFYPGAVNVIPNPAKPASLQDAYAIIAEVTGPNGVNDSEQHYEVYYRELLNDEEGNTQLGPWQCEHMSTDGAAYPVYKDKAVPFGVLPWVVWHNGVSDGTIFRDVDRDLCDIIDAVNINHTNLAYTIDMQAHSQLAYEGASREDIIGGPGKIISIDTGENIQVLDYNPKLGEMQNANQELIKTLASTRRQSPDAYSIQRQAPESGIARQIKNQPYIKAQRERTNYAEAMEELLFPVMVSINDYYGDGVKLQGNALNMRFERGEDPQFEDAATKTARISMALTDGMISKERAAVELGFYGTEDEAREAFAKEEAQNTEAPTQSIAERLRLAGA